MQRLRDLIVFFIRHFPHPLTRTELVKLIYLFEYEQVQTQGRQYSEVTFVRDKYGPFASSILAETEYLCSTGAIGCYCRDIAPDCIQYEYVMANPIQASKHDLPEWERGMALALIDMTAHLTLQQIKELAYSTPPMDEILSEEAKLGYTLLPRRINMKKGHIPKKFTKEELAAARRRLDACPDRGSDEEYLAAFLDTYKAFETLRRRATECLVQD